MPVVLLWAIELDAIRTTVKLHLSGMGDAISADAVWDAGDLGFGELLLALRTRVSAMPGQVLELVARDAGAYQDIPAWCRVTGNRLLHTDRERATYWIQSRADWN